MNEPTQSEPTLTGLGRIGRYELIAPMARGAMGVVYSARDSVLQREVAVKLMAASVSGDPELRARFEREARAAAQLSHPHVVTIHDLGYHSDGSPFIAMELLKGADLRMILRDGPALSFEARLSVILQTLAALGHAHRQGVVHRDIKPANIFLTRDGGLKILDFGVARMPRVASSTGIVFGTADYMSPEQVRGTSVDGRSDLFSCASVLFELITGHKPFAAEDIAGVVYKVSHQEPHFSLIAAGPQRADLSQILRKGLAKDVAERYQTAEEFSRDLARLLGRRALAPLAAFGATLPSAPETVAAAVLSAPPAAPEPTIDLKHGAASAPAVVLPEDQLPPSAPRRRRPSTTVLLGLAAGVTAAALAVAHLGGYLQNEPIELARTSARLEQAEGVASLPNSAPASVAPSPSPLASAALPVPRASSEPVPSQPAAPIVSSGGRAAAVPSSEPVAHEQVRPPTPAPRLEAGTLETPEPASRSVAEQSRPEKMQVSLPANPLQLQRFEGFLTDELCQKKGAIPDHWDCVQVCMRKGHRPLLLSQGVLYRIAGLERIRGDRNRGVVLDGYLDPETQTITVAARP